MLLLDPEMSLARWAEQKEWLLGCVNIALCFYFNPPIYMPGPDKDLPLLTAVASPAVVVDAQGVRDAPPLLEPFGPVVQGLRPVPHSLRLVE